MKYVPQALFIKLANSSGLNVLLRRAVLREVDDLIGIFLFRVTSPCLLRSDSAASAFTAASFSGTVSCSPLVSVDEVRYTASPLFLGESPMPDSHFRYRNYRQGPKAVG